MFNQVCLFIVYYKISEVCCIVDRVENNEKIG